MLVMKFSLSRKARQLPKTYFFKLQFLEIQTADSHNFGLKFGINPLATDPEIFRITLWSCFTDYDIVGIVNALY